MSLSFIHQTLECRVIFGEGSSSRLPAEARGLGRRLLVICDETAAELAGELKLALADVLAGSIVGVRQHVPLEDAQSARAQARELRADALLAIGGGSTIGLAKSVALTERLPIIALPTTYAGSEMTPVWGLTEGGMKTTGRDRAVAPRLVVYDPRLTYSLPARTTAASGMNAIAHCVDALWAAQRTPLTDVMAARGIEEMVAALPEAVRDGRDGRARERALVAAWLSGATFAIAGSSVHHKLCHNLGGRFDLPHAETHAAVLPWVVEVMARKLPDAGAAIARAIGAPDASSGISALLAQLGLPQRLTELGLDAGDVELLVKEIDPTGLASPVELTRGEVREIVLGAAGLSRAERDR